MKAIQEAILQKIVDQEESSVKPKFLGSTYRAEGAKLKAVEEKDLPKAIIVNAFFPDSAKDKSERILKLIKSQNDLSTTDWRILRRTQERSTVHLTMSITGPFHETLKKNGYKASFKFGQVGIRPKSAAKPPANPPIISGKPKGATALTIVA
ncbi:LOW QUALITY PROTEIN: uncharacterized protein LOC120356898 [Solenopsis invicta]|uniref:LOW QUALITY PROTEIN: uncharacterized protein LOC120356898 n=1 Tax=Solenopsis invicta TaxID=13686 RepID=UPI00193CFAAE|nr:LOW QUALITY PROTEIN: uncharacterized protein LOC120356898 [Solenopsis invicta]